MCLNFTIGHEIFSLLQNKNCLEWWNWVICGEWPSISVFFFPRLSVFHTHACLIHLNIKYYIYIVSNVFVSCVYHRRHYIDNQMISVLFQTTIQNLDNPISRRVRGVIQKIREERFGYLKVAPNIIFNFIFKMFIIVTT